jgi:tRNA pseudouridine55 synthase
MCWLKLQGFFNINKPQGITSFDVIRRIKKQIPRKCKIGHLGTLDPMATGVLPVAVGNATRVIEYAAGVNKEYIAAFILGGVSDTQDATGQITIQQEEVIADTDEVTGVLQQFTGRIEQIPPMYSAVHHQGRRLYELARQGVEVVREPREVTIEAIELLEISSAGKTTQVVIKVSCSPGTYIRTLVHDIGMRLGTGAYLNSLVRTRSGNFVLEQAVMLDEIVTAQDVNRYLLPIDHPLENMAVQELEAGQALVVRQGRGIKGSSFLDQQRVRLYDGQQLVAIAFYDAAAGILRPEKVFL